MSRHGRPGRPLSAIVKNTVAANRAGSWRHLNVIVADMNAALAAYTGGYLHKWDCGGIFSLDMVHPSSQGYKLLANEYIKALNGVIAGGKFFGVPPSLQAAMYVVP